MYSPSQTGTFDTCSIKWWLSYRQQGKGIQPALTTKQAMDRLAGRAAHSALKTWSLTRDLSAARAASEATLDLALQEMQEGALVAYELPTIAEVSAEVGRILDAYVVAYPQDRWRIVAAEHLFEVPSRCQPDMLVVDVDGEPAVVERKLVSAKAKWEDVKAQYQMDYQVTHYAWAFSDAIARGEFEGVTKPCRRVIMDLVKRTVKPVCERVPIEIPEHLYGIHQTAAARAWERMAAIDNGQAMPYPVWGACRSKYGTCEFFRLCHSGYDENVEASGYRAKAKEVPK